MSSFFSKIVNGLSGGMSGRRKAAAAPVTAEYQGLTICAEPERAGDQWRLAGKIVKLDGESVLERTFLRADTFASLDEAQTYSLRKGKQIIDERGGRLFEDGAESGRA